MESGVAHHRDRVFVHVFRAWRGADGLHALATAAVVLASAGCGASPAGGLRLDARVRVADEVAGAAHLRGAGAPETAATRAVRRREPPDTDRRRVPRKPHAGGRLHRETGALAQRIPALAGLLGRIYQ